MITFIPRRKEEEKYKNKKRKEKKKKLSQFLKVHISEMPGTI